ncbi:GntR family transcriptional regulator [Spiribacter vilamensis]|uniref:GntR family transcriptional regulator n=1 Tax=Spiribacter vilamensis TaxID=531306 RepID=A0A4Q8D1W2_9GAMM|nr:GntR family transcriptional regulator [Spiribacter vilamensis]TVO61644.1 GntR family transcriptional regulator [Spiribacter vilamensis]
MDTVTDQICRSVRLRILQGGFDGGDFLTEQAIADELGASTLCVHEALARLAGDGWVEIIPYRGARVIEWTREDSHEIFELRALLEAYAARRAAVRIRATQLARLRTVVDQELTLVQRPEPPHDVLSDLNLEFHQTILAAAGSRRLQRSLETVLHGATSARSTYGLTRSVMENALDEHARIVDALANGDGERAGDLMQVHILSVARGQPEQPT